MISLHSQLVIEVVFYKIFFEGFDKIKYFLTDSVNTLNVSAQPAKESLTKTSRQAINTLSATDWQGKDTVTVSTQKAVNALTILTNNSLKTITTIAQQAKASAEQSLEQTKASLQHTLQSGNLTNTMLSSIQTAINDSVSDWVQVHPVVLRLLQILLWATNHPIISLVILIFTIAIAWSLIKAIGRLIEIIGLSLLQAPLQLGQLLIIVSTKFLGKVGGLAVKQIGGNSEPLTLSSLMPIPNQQQRLAEISTRLEVLQKEQNELLQEAATLLNADNIDI